MVRPGVEVGAWRKVSRPSNIFRYSFAIIALAASLSELALAQSFPPASVDRTFSKSELQGLTGQEFGAGSASSDQDAIAGHGKVMGLDSLIGPVDDYCPNGQCEDTGEESTFTEGAAQAYPLAALLPPSFGSTVDALWSPTDAAIVNGHMSSTRPVQFSAIALTEPAVMAGVTAALDYANQRHNMSLLTGIHAASMAQYVPAAREMLGVYLDCMRTRFERAGLGYAEAQAGCLRDSGLPSTNFGTQGAPGGVPLASMSFNDSPGYQAALDITAPTDPSIGRLSKLLFNQHIYARIPGIVSHTSVDRARFDFVRNFGDIEYTIEAVTSGAVVTNRMVSKIDVLEPSWLPDDLLQVKIHERWALMNNVLLAACSWIRDRQESLAANNSGPIIQNSGSNPWGQLHMWGDLFDMSGPYQIATQIFRDISVQGYSFTTQEFDILVAEIRKDKRFRQANSCTRYFGESTNILPYCPFSAVGPLPPGINCLVPEPPVPFIEVRNPYTKASGGNPTPITRFLRDVVYPDFNNSMPRLFEKMFFIARFLSRIEILQEALVYISLIERLGAEVEAGGLGSRIQDAKKLIRKAINTDDVLGSIEEARAKLANYLNEAKLELERSSSGAAQSFGQIPANE